MASSQTVLHIVKAGEDNGTMPLNWEGEIKMVRVVRRKPGLTWEQFDTYWHKEHGPLVKECAAGMGFTKYIQTPAHRHPMIEQFKAA